MEFIFSNVKGRIDSLIHTSKYGCAGKLTKVILTHNEWNKLTGSMTKEEMDSTQSIGYRRMIYNGVEVHAQER